MHKLKSLMAKHRRMEYEFIRRLRISMYPIQEMPLQPSELKLLPNSIIPVLGAVFLIVVLLVSGCNEAMASEVDAERYCKAIYIIEGGAKTKHPYGILAKYKTTTPKQACINTVKHKYRDWVAKGQQGAFTAYLGSKYCPIGSDTDNGTCKNWVPNLEYYLARSK